MQARLGRYELLRRIARGGMAEVYLARRVGAASIEKRLVLKRILPEHARDSRFVDLFVREARLSMSLAHANIVPVFDFGRVDDELFLVMEHIDGADLGAALARAAEVGRPLDAVLVAAIGAAACEGLDYAHRRNAIVHRDVTPRNLLLSRAGEVKLVDFGVATLGGDAEGRVRGTPAYMAPEQARGEAVDGRADLYALGRVLVEALSGVRGKPGETPAIPEAVPAELARVLERSLAPRPEDRWRDAAEMGHALDAFVVAARASAQDDAPPARRLAAWIGALFPEDDPHAGASGTALPAVDKPGDATVRSIAETMAEAAGSPRRRWWIAAAPLLLLAGVATWVWWPHAAPLPPPAPNAVDATAAPVDASVAVVDAAARTPAAAAAPPDAAPGRPAPRRHPVIINSKPWARVFVDGKYVDDTPLETTLSAGRHRVRLENPLDGSSKEIVIEVPRDSRILETLP